MPIEHFVGCVTEHFFGHGRGAGGEIKDAHHEILEAGARATVRANVGEVGYCEDFAPEKEMAVCACAQTAIIALSPPTRQTRWGKAYRAIDRDGANAAFRPELTWPA
ncbi:hypothetical protein AAGS40_10885 [Paraburkholderia sp. PREW-6R]|uniref:hypothetical protein n=1 Tax=Paraburkholderia sp. PREW-6R TaxID=3141544 RepID=UPI0031F593A3